MLTTLGILTFSLVTRAKEKKSYVAYVWLMWNMTVVSHILANIVYDFVQSYFLLMWKMTLISHIFVDVENDSHKSYFWMMYVEYDSPESYFWMMWNMTLMNHIFGQYILWNVTQVSDILDYWEPHFWNLCVWFVIGVIKVQNNFNY